MEPRRSYWIVGERDLLALLVALLEEVEEHVDTGAVYMDCTRQCSCGRRPRMGQDCPTIRRVRPAHGGAVTLPLSTDLYGRDLRERLIESLELDLRLVD